MSNLTHVPDKIDSLINSLSAKMGGVDREVIIGAALWKFSQLDDDVKRLVVTDYLFNGKMSIFESDKSEKPFFIRRILNAVGSYIYSKLFSKTVR